MDTVCSVIGFIMLLFGAAANANSIQAGVPLIVKEFPIENDFNSRQVRVPSINGPGDGGDKGSNIINGKKANRGEYPWQVYFTRKFLSGERELWSFCGGAIVDENTVITAAHCIAYDPTLSTGNYTITAGTLHMWEQYPDEHVQDRRIISVTLHPDYVGKATQYDNDVAVFKLETPLNFTKYVQPAKFANRKTEARAFKKGECMVVGWGLISKGHVTISTIRWPSANKFVSLQIWTNSYSCESGGAVMCEYRNEKILVGLVSWGDYYCNQVGFGAHTILAVATLRQWIEQTI